MAEAPTKACRAQKTAPSGDGAGRERRSKGPRGNRRLVISRYQLIAAGGVSDPFQKLYAA
jgi:hypothetical protein